MERLPALIEGLLAGKGADRLEADMIAEGFAPNGADTLGDLDVPMA